MMEMEKLTFMDILCKSIEDYNQLVENLIENNYLNKDFKLVAKDWDDGKGSRLVEFNLEKEYSTYGSKHLHIVLYSENSDVCCGEFLFNKNQCYIIGDIGDFKREFENGLFYCDSNAYSWCTFKHTHYKDAFKTLKEILICNEAKKLGVL